MEKESTTLFIFIHRTFPSLNEFIAASKQRKGNWNAGAAMKKRDQAIIRRYLPHARLNKPVRIDYTFYEPNRRRDHDNVASYFHKVFQDALVDAGILEDDGWGYITGYSDTFYVDRKAPRILVTITEE